MSTELPAPVPPTDDATCSPRDIALKSFFLGPQAENAEWLRQVINQVFESYVRWRREVYPDDGRAISQADRRSADFQERRRRFGRELLNLLGRFESEVPKYSPRYIGHMFSETSMPAMVGHVLTLLHNPNNISGESSRVGVRLESEAIGALAAMFAMAPEQARGHFTSGGTVANFEAMTRARSRLYRFLSRGARARACGTLPTLGLVEAAHLGWSVYDELGETCPEPDDDPGLRELMEGDLLAANPFMLAGQLERCFEEPYRGPVILVGEHKHYSWVKGVELLGLGREALWAVRLNEEGTLSLPHLEARLNQARAAGRPVLMVVSVAGTTELGAFDRVDQVQDLLDRRARELGEHIWHHVDAAYGGFFAANVCADQPDCVLNPGVCQALQAIHRANSVTLDPHKLGYVPYASGAFIAREQREYAAHQVDAPYLAFDEIADPGPQTIEGSRSAAGAVATWLTARTIGLDAQGYGRILRRTLQARARLEERLSATAHPVRLLPATSNLLAFCVAHPGESLSRVNARSEAIFERFGPGGPGDFFVSKTTLTLDAYGALLNRHLERWELERDVDRLTVIRLSVMNPFIDAREMTLELSQGFADALATFLDAHPR
ncbi:hypothetical protein DL240_16480 [Lujinxingia litoralis]|uniref:Pyridoxal-dependent decarboxylase n=1 Tax=Lujinxingia litoralis TaxID=2211119 RepID=A0A328C205_9DELT|nr:pyridoxal-dependent decarboxylase [Lujinxingia litoralis]RAL20627.1 hypothetical protein DL240_16480 [Lujinxingia litoralis]